MLGGGRREAGRASGARAADAASDAGEGEEEAHCQLPYLMFWSTRLMAYLAVP